LFSYGHMYMTKNSVKTILTYANSVILFVAVCGAVFAIGKGIMEFYNVSLKSEFVPDISGPVSRFIADVDFENREVHLDATISKTTDSEKKITIWRLGDGKMMKADEHDTILDNESLTYQFEEPGTYTISYSIIDDNDLSDEAFCTVTFFEASENEPADQTADMNNQDFSNSNVPLNAYGMPVVNTTDTSCGKSYVSYNQSGGIDTINTYRAQIREGLVSVGAGVIILIAGVLLNKLIVVLFIKKRLIAAPSEKPLSSTTK
jgi:hypothetical protein